MAKYNFYELKRNGKKLPVNVNSAVEKIATDSFNDEGLNKELNLWREKKLYGEVHHYKEFMVKGRKIPMIAVIFKFQHGMCTSFDLLRPVSESVIRKQSILNENLEIRKIK